MGGQPAHDSVPLRARECPRHREAGGDEYSAGIAYLRAANLARGRYATTKASEYYQHGLELVADRAVVMRLEALHNHGDVLQLTGRIDDALFAFEEMLTLADAVFKATGAKPTPTVAAMTTPAEGGAEGGERRHAA